MQLEAVWLILFLCFEFAFRIDAVQIKLHSVRPSQHRVVGVGGSTLSNVADVSYYINVRLGGKSFQLLVDTGSSDIWVAGTVPGSETTGFSSKTNYAMGSVEGPVKTADIDLAGYVIPGQAFMEIQATETNPDGTGMLGLGPNSASNVFVEMNGLPGAAVMDRLFTQYINVDQYLTILLGRSASPTAHGDSSLTIGEVLDGYTDILRQPRIPVTRLANSMSSQQHFQILLDEDGIIGPDHQAVPLQSAVSGTLEQKRLTAVIDTGFTLPQIPEGAAAAIYGRIRGAELANVPTIGKAWIVPCDQEVNITLKFAGNTFPIHPLDATLDPSFIGFSDLVNSKGQKACIGTFQPFSFNLRSNPTYDIILGMAFLRNIYFLICYGNFVFDSTNTSEPYIQFLSTTKPADAHLDFVNVRLNGVDTTGNQGLLDDEPHPKLPKRVIYCIVAVIIGIAAAAAVVIFFLTKVRRQRTKDTTKDSTLEKAVLPPAMRTR